jgi:hypothetical protein
MIHQKQISDTTLALLAYWRAALADSSLFHPVLSKDCAPIQVGQNDAGIWRVTQAPQDWIETTFAASKMPQAEASGGARKPIPLLLMPALLAVASKHGVKLGGAAPDACSVPLCIPALLTPDGALLADSQHLPWIPRELLEPSLNDVGIGLLADLDEHLTQLTRIPDNLCGALRVAQELFAHVTGCRLALLPPAAATLAPDPAQEPPVLPLLEIEDYGVIDGWFGIAYEPPFVAQHLIRLYDLLAEGPVAIPLLETLAHLPDRPTQQPLPLAEATPRYKKIVGHINRQHPLSPSQHEAMVELLGMKDGDILAVNGPPGTGKTTLLQSVVAQEWVMAAINGAPCPIIAAASTNVRAVENILDSFARLGQGSAYARWLPEIGGFGLFLASASRDSDHPTYNNPDRHHFKDVETPDWVSRAKLYYLEQAKNCPLLTGPSDTVADVTSGLRKLLQSHHSFLQEILAQRYRIFSVTGTDETAGARSSIQGMIAQYQQQRSAIEHEIAQARHTIADCKARKIEAQAHHAGVLREIGDTESAWNAHLAASPLWLDLFAFMPPCRRRRNALDRIFLLSQPQTNHLQHRDDGVTAHFIHARQQAVLDLSAAVAQCDQTEQAAIASQREAEARQTSVTAQLRQAEALLHQWLTLLGDTFAAWADVALCDINDRLDIGIRAPMFQFADWYWSGCWLLEMEARFRDSARDSKAPQKLESMLRRFAKIAPCMVVNFHMAPNIFMGWLGQPQPLWNVIDLLIVDEAGQVAPEVGAPTFALAKRAVVVGDAHQIEPIWNVPESTDRANAAKFGLIKKWDDPRYVKMEQDGYTAARGNLMHMSARACRLRKYPDIRGLLLTEHRRCVPELIAYCNQLVYGGRLEPKRAAIPPDQRILPPFGYLPVPGKDRKVGGSRNNHGEAQAIVDWIVRHRAALEHHYRHPTTGQALHISQIIGIVTPFAPQAGLIASMLRKALPDTRQKGRTITVGTVHRLQGAEREIVLFSPVYGDDHKGGMFFDNGPNMLNVAVSRARDSFLVFGNLALFNPQKSGSPSGVLAQYLFKHPENNLEGARCV